MKRLALCLMIFFAAGTIMAGGRSDPPSDEGVGRGELVPCPESPNCVNTIATDAKHGIAALPFRGSKSETMDSLLLVVEQMVRTTIITRTDDYLHVEYRTRRGFVDDVEFRLDADRQVVNFRSASRVGYWDLGLNRKRMERFRALYEALP